MEAIISVLQALHLNLLEVSIAAIFVFVIGYWFGRLKVKKMTEEIYSLQRHVLDLNSELLYGKNDSETPVIEIKHETKIGSKIAK